MRENGFFNPSALDERDYMERKSEVAWIETVDKDVPFEEKAGAPSAGNPLKALKSLVMSTGNGRRACALKAAEHDRPPFVVTASELVEIAEDLIETGGHDGDVIELWMADHVDELSSL